MHEYPKTLFRAGDEFEWDGRKLALLIVHSPDEAETARKEGWQTVEDVLFDKPVKKARGLK